MVAVFRLTENKRKVSVYYFFNFSFTFFFHFFFLIYLLLYFIVFKDYNKIWNAVISLWNFFCRLHKLAILMDGLYFIYIFYAVLFYL